MKCVKGVSFLLWISFYLTRISAHKPETGQERRINDGYGEVICDENTLSAMLNCGKRLFPLTTNGFPWGMAKETEIQKDGRNWGQLQNIIRDPLDPLNEVCGVYDDFLKCMDRHATPYVCMLSGNGLGFKVHTVFNFICHKEQRTIDLLHSLRCLQETRVVDLLAFHLAIYMVHRLLTSKREELRMLSLTL